MDVPDEQPQRRVASLLRKRPIGWRRANGGYTPAERWIATFEDGTSCFVKSGLEPQTAGWLRSEYRRIYSQVKAPFLPRVLAWQDDERAPLLILEDLSAGHWPPPWRSGDVERVLDTLTEVRALPVADLPPIDAVVGAELRDGWQAVGEYPALFLALGLTSEGWLRDALRVLQEATASAVLEGDDVLHLDTRSDNVCFVGERCVMIDWNHACRGNGDLDIAGWLPSLHSEGGPLPEALLPDVPELAAVISGYFASHAGLAPIPNAPRVRQVQLSQLRSALPWAVRALGLPPLDGPNAP